MVDAVEEKKIAYQLETGLPGSTDAARICLAMEGVPSGVVSIPTRCIHSPTALLSIKDAENCVKLIIAAIQEVPKYF